MSMQENPIEPINGNPPRLQAPPGGYDYPASDDQPVDWRRYLTALWRFKWFILAITLAGSAVGVVASRLLPPEYVAQLNVWVRASAGGEAGEGPIQSSELFTSYAWVDLLKTYLVLDSVVDELQLYLEVEHDDAEVFRTLAPSEDVVLGEYRIRVGADGQSVTLEDDGGRALERGAVGDTLGRGFGFRWVPREESLEPGRTIHFAIESARDVASDLSDRLYARIDRNGNFIRITLSGQNPQKIATILNAVGDRYMEVADQLKNELLSQVADILDEQLRYAELNLREAEQALERFRVETVTLPSERGMAIAPGLQITQSPAMSNYFELKIELDQVRADRDAVRRALDQSAPWQTLELVPAIADSPALARALTELAEARAELRALQSRYTDQHPLVRAALSRVSELERNVIPDLAARLLVQLEQREAELQGNIDSASGELREVPERAIQEAALERRVEIRAEFYQELQVRREVALLAEANALPDLTILDTARPPQRPINHKDGPRLILMALLGSLGLALAGAILLDRFDPRIKYPNQVSFGLGLSILGAVPHVSNNKERHRLRNVDEVVEAFRMIRLGVQNAYGNTHPIVVAVTSPGAEEGKSFVAANLALAFADLGYSTVVVDADVRRGHLHRLFSGLRKPGLIDYLAGETAKEQLIQSTPFKHLKFVGSGSRRQSGPEFLQSRAMAALLDDLRSSFDVVILDTPPLGVGGDTLALATLVASVVIVLRTGKTDRAGTEVKLELLDRLPVRVLGAVINDISAGPGSYYYYSPYYTSYLPGYEARDEVGEVLS
jgi:capsular exopolysaccharide synthesis family protein